MSTITRRFQVIATKTALNGGIENIKLGRATEWDGEGILIELDTLPVGKWWGGTARLLYQRAEGDAPGFAGPLRQYDLVVGKRKAVAGVETKTTWLKLGSAQEIAGHVTLDMTTYPAGNWWDGKLRLFIQKPKKVK